MYSRISYFYCLILILCIFFISNLLAQRNTRPTKFGLSAVIQDSQFDILVPFWISPKTTIAPGIRFLSISNSSKDIGIGLVPRFYFNTNKLSPFLSFKGAILIYSSEESETVNDYLLGAGLGGEYFFDPHFSVGIEAQLNFTISAETSTRFNNPGGTNINTASVIFASIYF